MFNLATVLSSIQMELWYRKTIMPIVEKFIGHVQISTIQQRLTNVSCIFRRSQLKLFLLYALKSSKSLIYNWKKNILQRMPLNACLYFPMHEIKIKRYSYMFLWFYMQAHRSNMIFWTVDTNIDHIPKGLV